MFVVDDWNPKIWVWINSKFERPNQIFGRDANYNFNRPIVQMYSEGGCKSNLESSRYMFLPEHFIPTDSNINCIINESTHKDSWSY